MSPRKNIKKRGEFMFDKNLIDENRNQLRKLVVQHAELITRPVHRGMDAAEATDCFQKILGLLKWYESQAFYGLELYVTTVSLFRKMWGWQNQTKSIDWI